MYHIFFIHLSVENRPMDTAGKEEGGTNAETSTDIHTPPCVTDSSQKVLHNTGNPAWCSVMT